MAGEVQKSNVTWKRGRAIALAVLPLLLLILSLVAGTFKRENESFAGVGFAIAAACIAVVNLYLSYVRPGLFKLLRGKMEGYKFVSGLPMIGSVLLILTVIFGFGAEGSALIGIGAYFLDTGGPLWFVIATWRDRTLWE